MLEGTASFLERQYSLRLSNSFTEAAEIEVNYSAFPEITVHLQLLHVYVYAILFLLFAAIVKVSHFLIQQFIFK